MLVRFSACRGHATATPQDPPLSASLISLCSGRQATSLRWCLALELRRLELRLELRLAELSLVELPLRLRRLVVVLRVVVLRVAVLRVVLRGAVLLVAVLLVAVLRVVALRTLALRLLRLVELPLAELPQAELLPTGTQARVCVATLLSPMFTRPLSTSCCALLARRVLFTRSRPRTRGARSRPLPGPSRMLLFRCVWRPRSRQVASS